MRSQEAGLAKVAVKFREFNGGNHAVEWEGDIELVQERGEWRIENMRELSAVQNGAALELLSRPNPAGRSR